MEFNAGDAFDPDVVQISAVVFAIAYEGNNGDGFVTTVEITAAGQITDAAIDTLEFDPADGHEPVIVSAGGDTFALAYRGPADDGFFSTIQIDSLGQITDTVLDTIEFDTSTCFEPSMTTSGAGLFTITYRGLGNDGHVVTIELE